MLSHKIKRDITRRLGVFVKYTLTGCFYWDTKLEKFVTTKTYNYWMWCTIHYLGQLLQTILSLRLFLGLATSDGIPDTIENSDAEDDQRILLAFVALMYWEMVTCTLALGSITTTHREEMMETLNQLLKIDEDLVNRLMDRETNSFEDSSHNKLVAFICYVPLTFPLLSISYFHQSDPIHDITENLLEIPVALDSWVSWTFLGLYAYGTLAFMGSGIPVILICLLSEITIEDWLAVTMPTEFAGYFVPINRNQVSTEKLGTKSESDMIWLYRSLQVISRLANSWIADVRLAYHSFAIQVIAIVTSFALIRYSRSLLEKGSPTEISLIWILAIAMGLSVFLFYVECQMADIIDSEWRVYKKRLMQSSGRNSSMYKAAKSLGSVAVMTAYPCCNVNKSTFLEWCSVVVDNLVSLLVSF